jgi:Tfp pilus assembly PilM family ATPase
MPGLSDLSSWWTSPPPAVGLEFTAAQVTAVAVAAGAPLPVAARHATVPLPPGALVPALATTNVVDRAAVSEAVRQALEAVGRPRRIAVVLPDVVARLAVVRLDSVPGRVEERDQLLRWHVRKAAPFEVDAAQVSIAPGRRLDDGAQEFVVALALREVVREYEEVCAAASAQAGVVDVATSALIHLAGRQPGRQAGDWMLVHLGADYSTLAIVRDRVPIFFRSRGPDAEGSLADTVHQAAMYYEDRLAGQALQTVVVVDPANDADTLVAIETTVRQRWQVGVEPLDLSQAVQFGDRIGVSAGASAVMAAAAGIVMREA